MTTALYRRYRPETFAEVIGQPQVTEPLRRALQTGRVGHAYLFSGPRGCGKTTSARILARTLNCEQNTPEQPIDIPCGECDSCLDLATGGPGSLDVVEIDAASHGGVDDARDLRDRATFAPTRDRYKIFIIDEAHMVSPQGFNALLKIVEEPPPHVKFFFATTEPDRVLPTIRSRTHHYPFRLVPADVLGPYIEQICEREGFGLGQGVLPLVLRAGAGSVRDTLSVLDQLIAGADGSSVEYEHAVALLGYTDAALLDEVVDAVAASDGAALFGVIERIIETGHPPQRFVEDLLGRLRDLIVIAVAGDAAAAALRDQPPGEFERMRAQAASLGLARLSVAADLVSSGLQGMTGATSPRLQVELLAARLLLGEQAESTAVPSDVAGSAPQPRETVQRPVKQPKQPESGAATPDATEAPTRATEAPTRATEAPTRAAEASTRATDAPTRAPEAPTGAPETPTRAPERPTGGSRPAPGAPQPPPTAQAAPPDTPASPSAESREPSQSVAPASDDQRWLDLAASAQSKQEIGEIGKRAKAAGASPEVLAELREQYRRAQESQPPNTSRPANSRRTQPSGPQRQDAQASATAGRSQPSGPTGRSQPAGSSRPGSQPPGPPRRSTPDANREPEQPPEQRGAPPGDSVDEAWERGYPDDIWLDADEVPPLGEPSSFDDEPEPPADASAETESRPKAAAAPEPPELSTPPSHQGQPEPGTAQNQTTAAAIRGIETDGAVPNSADTEKDGLDQDVDELAEISEDDPVLESTGLVGVPLVLRILGGRIVAEETDVD